MPGQTVLGTVIIDVKKRHKVGVVQLILQGKEEVHRTEHPNSDDLPTTILRQNEKSILRLVIPLADENQQWVEQGTYPLNFEVGLPEDIPASVRYGNDKNGWSIQYSIIVAALGYHQSEWPLVVRSVPAPRIQSTLFLQPRQQRIDTMGFSRVGHVTIGAKLDKKTVGRGRFLNVTVACVNNTSVDVRSVSIKLIQEISTTIDFEKHYEKVTLVDMKVADYSGMVASRPKENLYSAYAARPTLPASNVQSDSQQIHDALASGNKNYVPMKIPAVSDLRYVELRITHESLMSRESFIDCQRQLRRKNSECKPLCQDQTCHIAFHERSVSENPDQDQWLNDKGECL
jgi:hypothetical protein